MFDALFRLLALLARLLVGALAGLGSGIAAQMIERAMETRRPAFRCGTALMNELLFLAILGAIVAFLSRPAAASDKGDPGAGEIDPAGGRDTE